jgi:phenylacetate-coenzyme A ligase PaaK-like adenylate-forming protein
VQEKRHKKMVATNNETIKKVYLMFDIFYVGYFIECKAKKNMQTVYENLTAAVKNVTPHTFEETALAVFQYQYKNNSLYKKYIDLLHIKPENVVKIAQIPYLPIAFFKNKDVKTGNWVAETTFTSSGTTGATTSRHAVKSLDWYLQNTTRGFDTLYRHPKNYCWLALLPSYLEREGSSLIAMAQHFIEISEYKESGFFLNDLENLVKTLKKCQKNNIPTVLIGVSFALLDVAEAFPMSLDPIILMETGGMKGRKKEITKQELHETLKNAFQLPQIHSEYGMTELLSQGYSKGNNIYEPAPTMRIFIRDITDPFEVLPPRRTGIINVIDLANIDTCSFIATDDLGKMHADGTFEVLGRVDNSDMRGCNLLI